MSHEPTDEELRAAIDTWGKPGTGGLTISLTAANSLRDRRIRAEALEELLSISTGSAGTAQ